MKRYMLDTSLLAAYFHNRTKAVHLMTVGVKDDEVATSILVYGEVIEYFKGLPNSEDNAAKLHKILDEIPPYPLTYPIMERYAEIHRYLRPQHIDIGDIDTLIAATSFEENLTLVTIDHDFERVPKLKFQLVNLKAA